MDVIAAAHKYQLRVPRDLSVVVFDDISASGLVASHLTTVNQPMKEKGRLAVSSLQDCKNAPLWHELPAKLVVRQSTARSVENVVALR
jgi:LacI family transcriptional regulator